MINFFFLPWAEAHLSPLIDPSLSGYRFLHGVRGDQGGFEILEWSVIWKLPVPTKVNNLIWRAGAELLPTMLALHGRRAMSHNVCPPKDTLHAFFECSIVRNIWVHASFDVSRGNALSFID